MTYKKEQNTRKQLGLRPNSNKQSLGLPPGGFPKGVTLENILKVSSTPRSRLMTEIMEKTGLVERSGQGVDKIFSISLSDPHFMGNYPK